MEKLTRLFQALLFCGLAVAIAACTIQTEGERRAEANYARLCNIFEVVQSRQLSYYERGVMLDSKLRHEVLELRIPYRNIVKAAPENAYGLYKGAAEAAINKPWDCPAIKEYYQFGQMSNP